MAGLYIHMPFCAHKCDYCDFVSFVCNERTKKAYIDSLCKEIRMAAQKYADREIDTVFIGGGTPSILPHGEIKRVMSCVFSMFNVKSTAEITIECNPGTLDLEKLCEYKDCGINRLSIGLQGANDTLLKSISRIHTRADFLRSIELARGVGFQNINADIMYGLPGQTTHDIDETLQLLLSLALTHISAYSLILEENTPLYAMVQTGKVMLPDEDAEYAMHRYIIDTLSGAGYLRYEISNYAKTGYECRHNLAYWDQSEYIGVGVNAHSAMNIDGIFTRYYNSAKLIEYSALVAKNSLPIVGTDAITGYDKMAEYVMLGLRKVKGFSISDFNEKFGCDFFDIFGEKLKRIGSDLYVLSDSISLTDKGLDLQNAVLCELL